MAPEQIDFDAMQVGQRADLAKGDWEGAPRQQFNAASAYCATHEGVQFQVDSEWVLNPQRGVEERRYYITRTR